MEKNYAVEYTTLKKYMDALKDELSSSCGNSEEIFNCIAEKYKNNGKSHVILDPGNDKKKIEEILESPDNDVRKGMLCEDIKEFTEAFYDELAFIYGEKNAIYLAEEAKRLVDSYDNCYDEDSYVYVHPDVLLARRSRIVDEFESLSKSEFEKEYLLMYNSYTSALRYNSLFENELVSLTSEEAVCNVVSATASKYSRKMEEGNTAHLLRWNPEAVHNLKERFLKTIANMDHESAKVCYMEISDIWLGTVQLGETFKEECRNAIGQDIVNDAILQVDQNVAKNFSNNKMSDQEIEESLTESEKETLGELFGTWED